ncbi:MAG: haloacid dehalogenase [Nitrospira sp. SCN 59-13]|nr:MAG: haloacid dehalogenase [Nitrospira sp. SCN 59-13]
MTEPRVVVLFDVDNTLLDNDRIAVDLTQHLDEEIGTKGERQYWAIFEELREKLGYVDYLGALQRYRQEYPRDPHLFALSRFLLNYPFAERVFPHVHDVIRQTAQWAKTVILSDGDIVFQPRKIDRSGLFEAVEGHILIYIHKEQELDDVEQRYPADHYVLVDDKLRILTAVKAYWGARVTTVFPRQGHYATDPEVLRAYPAADLSIDRIGELLTLDQHALLAAATPRR